MPLVSKVAVCASRGVFSVPVVLHVPLTGSYNSPVAARVCVTWPPPLTTCNPPATKTFPLINIVAVCSCLAVASAPFVVHKPVAGSYNSEIAIEFVVSYPPATSNLPLDNNVVVCATLTKVNGLFVKNGDAAFAEKAAVASTPTKTDARIKRIIPFFFISVAVWVRLKKIALAGRDCCTPSNGGRGAEA